jgi:hypothetical protein
MGGKMQKEGEGESDGIQKGIWDGKKEGVVG